MIRQRLIAIGALVVIGGAFLAGRLPERTLRTATQQHAVSLRQQLEAAEARVRIGQLLGQVFAVRDVAARQDYEQAQELSSMFFDSVREEASAVVGEEFRSVLNEVLSRRDTVTASLAKADPEVIDVLRSTELALRRVLGYPVPLETPAE